MHIINTNELRDVRKRVSGLRADGSLVVVRSQDSVFNRKIFEMKEVDMVVGLESGGSDRSKQRDSGMNEVLAKLAVQNGIDIGVEVRELAKQSSLEQAVRLGRIMQNIQLCKRVGARIVFLGVDAATARSLMLVLGGSTGQAKNAFYSKSLPL